MLYLGGEAGRSYLLPGSNLLRLLFGLGKFATSSYFDLLLRVFVFSISRIHRFWWPSSGDNKHSTRPHTILKNKKAKNGERSRVFVFFSMVWGRVG